MAPSGLGSLCRPLFRSRLPENGSPVPVGGRLMAMLGECLVFHLKYVSEMRRLYWSPRESGEKLEVEGLEDAVQTITMVRAVGDASCREAADFVEACLDKVEEHFRSLCHVEIGGRAPRRSAIEYD